MRQIARETGAVAQRILTELLRRQRSLLFWGMFPISILLLIGMILTGRTDLSIPEAFEQAAVCALVGSGFFFSGVGGTVSTIVAEREQGTLKRLFLSPMSGLSYFLGIFLAYGVVAAGQVLLVALVAAYMGARFHGDWWLGTLIVGLTVAAYVGSGFVLGTQLARRTDDVNALVAAFGLPFVIIGGTFLPTTLFPENLLEVARYTPVYHMNEALLRVAIHGDGWADVGEHLTYLAVFSGAMVVVGWASYVRMVQRERQL
ncbi:MAG: ABC transporter permease [Gloeomargarita sp. SKYB31]|nr:ABC transporter permease [Gloeomargarita sp. SKYB31]